MSGLGELDRPGAPGSAEAWDERSQEWTVEETQTRSHEWATEETETEAPEGTAGLHPQVSGRPPKLRRTAADPVKTLMHRHRELCERAVDPLEIAAGLEAHGVTDRTASRFRHRDVFSLAEEMYARAAHDEETTPPSPALTAPRARPAWIVLTLLPGALCAATVATLHLAHGQARTIAAATGVLAMALALRTALARGPLGATDRTSPRSTQRASGSRAWTCWLVAYALLGDGLLRAAIAGGPDGPPTGIAHGPWPLATAPVLALALACAPAAWCAHLFAVSVRRRLSVSRGLEEFTASARPLLLGMFVLFLSSLTALSALCGAVLGESAAYARTVTLGALLFLARLLTARGFFHAPAFVLRAAATAEATVLASVFAARLPGCGFFATPVETAADAWGAGSVPALACAAAASALLIHAARTLTRASAHAPADRPC